MCEAVHRATAAMSGMSYETWITILLAIVTVALTALTALVAVLAIGVAVFALWGYTGIQREVLAQAVKKMDAAMGAKLQEYPAAKDIIDVYQRLKAQTEFIEQMQTQMITQPESNAVASSSNSDIHEGNLSVGVSSEETIEPYPGEESSDVPEPTPDPASEGREGADPGTNPR